MDHESLGVVRDIMGILENTTTNLMSAFDPTSTGGVTVVEDLPVSEEVIASWNLQVLGMDPEAQSKIVLHLFFDAKDSVGRIWAEVPVFRRFGDIVRSQYHDNPYHNFSHATDVTSCVTRVMRKLRCNEWLSDIDQYALSLAAFCHDISHPGRTTPFLVEMRHELAVRYNDSSPLENMHCAKLFEICNVQEADVFQKFEKEAFKQARKVCITAILHSDNALHFEMVKAVKDVYDQTSDVCDAQAKDWETYSDHYIEEVLCKYTSLWHKLLLHLCDVSTPLKPWQISRSWATRVQEVVAW
jgi:hypothetical protein